MDRPDPRYKEPEREGTFTPRNPDADKLLADRVAEALEFLAIAKRYVSDNGAGQGQVIAARAMREAVTILKSVRETLDPRTVDV